MFVHHRGASMKIPVQTGLILAFVCVTALAKDPEVPLAIPDLKSWTEIAQRIVRNSQQDRLQKETDADCEFLSSILHKTPRDIVDRLPLTAVVGLGEEINRIDPKFLSPTRVGLEDAVLDLTVLRLITEVAEGRADNPLIWKCLDLAGALRSNMRSQLRSLSQKHPPGPGETGPAEGESVDSRLQRTSNRLAYYLPNLRTQYQTLCQKLFPGKSQAEQVKELVSRGVAERNAIGLLPEASPIPIPTNEPKKH